MKTLAIREEICRVGRSLFERGYVHATAGNISVRLNADEGRGFLITPTDACLGFLEPDRLALLDENGVQTGGDRASKTILLHQRIYQATATDGASARCIIHTHSTYCVALTLGKLLQETSHGRELLPALTPYFAMKVGHVPIMAYARPGDPEIACQVGQTIARYRLAGIPLRAIMLEKLGPNVWHESPAAAMATLEELEETARLWHLSNGTAEALSHAQLDVLRTTFGAVW
ncbi:MAG: aldolase [Polaromonas sp.]